MYRLRLCCGFKNVLWMCLFMNMRSVGAGVNIYLPADPLTVNAKTILTLVTQEATWNEAVAICKTKYPYNGGTLAKVDSAEAVNALTNITDAVKKNVWFGLYWKEVAADLKLYWSDPRCTAFDTSGYQRFKKNEEVNTKGPGSKLCYVMDKHTGDWFKANCKEKNYFVCEHMDFSASNCATNNHSQFSMVPATFYSVPKNGTNDRLCISDCSSTLGCFLTWSGNNMCLFGILNASRNAFVRNRCIETAAETTVPMYESNNEDEPQECVNIDRNVISGVRATPISSLTPLSGICTNNTASQPIFNTLKINNTPAAVRTWTTTITSLQIVTTTDFRTTAVHCLGTATMAAIPVEESMTYETAYRGRQTIVLPTSEVVSVSNHPITSAYTKFPSYPLQLSTVSYPCSSQTIIKETINYITLTVNNYPTTSCATSYILIKTYDSSESAVISTTVTDPGLPTINEIDIPYYDNPSMMTTTLNIAPTTIVTSVKACCTLITTIASFTTTTITITATPVITAMTECATSTSIFNLVTIAQVRMATQTCDILTSSQVQDIAMTATAFVTMTVTRILESTPLQTETASCMCRGKNINETVIKKDIGQIQHSLVANLKISTSNLSSTRRKKESAADDRITAKIPGVFATALLISVFCLLVLIDLPLIVRDLKCKVRNQSVV